MTDTRKRLLTLVHVSDLHFGVPSAEDGWTPPDYWRRSRIFDGLLGHHKDALVHLSAFVKDIRRREKPAHVVVTGDLTACGRDSEFALAQQFLTGITTVGSNKVGLDSARVMECTIPGNHDHWPGTGHCWGAPRHLSSTFPVLPIPPTTLKLGNGRRLVILGVDSDAQIRPRGVQRFLARGRFETQLIALERQLGPPQGHEVRVLLLHHSPGYQSSPLRGRPLMVENGSRRALDAWIKEAGVSVILTGHVHLPGAYLSRVSDRGVSWDVLEARCGTTTQVDRMPLSLVSAGAEPECLPTNTLLVHRLFDDGGGILWECDLYVRQHDGFQRHDQPLMVDGEPLRPVVVWPRRRSVDTPSRDLRERR